MQVEWVLVGGEGGQQGIVFFRELLSICPRPRAYGRAQAFVRDDYFNLFRVLVEKLLIMPLCLSSEVLSPILS